MFLGTVYKREQGFHRHGSVKSGLADVGSGHIVNCELAACLVLSVFLLSTSVAIFYQGDVMAEHKCPTRTGKLRVHLNSCCRAPRTFGFVIIPLVSFAR